MGANARTLGDPDGAGLEDWLNDYIGALSANGVFNLSLTYSVGSSALTIAAKQQGGSDATSDQPAVVNMRSATATSGDTNVRSITAALSVVVSSGSTLGNANSDSYWNYVYLIDNAGTLELAVSAKFHGMQGIVSTTAEGGAGAADSATVMYSTSARASVAFRCVGRFKGPQTVAGTWAAVPTSAEMAPFANADSILDGSARDQAAVASGTVSAPAYSFSADTDSGLYRIGANNLGVAVNGAKVLDVGTGGLAVTGLVSATTQLLGGTATTGAGYGLSAALTADTAGGQTVAAVLKTSVTAAGVLYAWNADTSGDNLFTTFSTEAGGTTRGTIDYNRAGGAVRYNTTSNPKLKNIFGEADIAVCRAIVMGTEVIRYEWKDNPGREQIGVSAKQVYDSGFRGAVSMDADGDPAGVDKTAWTFHMLAMIKDHEQRLQALEAA